MMRETFDVPRPIAGAFGVEAVLQSIADLATQSLQCPIAVIRLGSTSILGASGISVRKDHPWAVTHANTDLRLLADPMRAAEAGLHFYAGVPVRATDGHHVGTLAVLDDAPRELADDELAFLKALARLAAQVLDLQLRTRDAPRGRITAAA